MPLDSKDLQWVLALVRGRSLPEAALRLGVDTSSVYRAIKRIEKQLGRALFDRSAQGMAPTELAERLAERAAAIEAELQAAHELLGEDARAPGGTLRITTNDLLLHGVLMPQLAGFRARHPRLDIELQVSNEPARLDRREADVALRGTNQPPPHLVGTRLGTMRVSLWASRGYLAGVAPGTPVDAMHWAAPEADPHLPDYPSRRWRRTHHPAARIALRCDNMLAVVRAIEAGVAIGVAPDAMLEQQHGMVRLEGPLDGIAPECWLLTHPDLRGLARVRAFFEYLRGQPWPA